MSERMMSGSKTALIRTFSGRELNPLDLQESDVYIEDIAHALALCNRFAGHTKRPISVAQHSTYVARLCSLFSVFQNTVRKDNSIALQGLLHDASEAYLGDVTKWLKDTDELAGYRKAEERAQIIIYKKFGCPTELHSTVEQADRIMVRFEGIQGFGPDFKIDHPDYPKLKAEEIEAVGKWGSWGWKTSEDIFLTHFRMYNK